MSNTVNVNYMKSAVNRFAKSVTQKTALSTSFGEMLESTGAQTTGTVEISAADATEAVPRADMTMDAYKQSIFDQISLISSSWRRSSPNL